MSNPGNPRSSGDQRPKWAMSGDKLAIREEENWDDEESLKGIKKKNQFRVLLHSGYIVVLLMWFFVGVFSMSVTVWLIHFLGPDGCYATNAEGVEVANCMDFHWLTATQISSIQSVIFSGAVAALVSSYVQKYLNNG